MGVRFTATEEKGQCAECADTMKAGQFALLYRGFYLCSQACAESFRENYVGRDYVAAHDQSIETAKEALMSRPRDFIFLYSNDEHEISSCIMARPEFVVACIPMLAEMSMMEGDIQPPPD